MAPCVIISIQASVSFRQMISSVVIVRCLLLAGVAVIDRKIYVLGGEEGWDRYHDTIECYDPVKDEWNIVAKLLSSRSWLGCVPLRVSYLFSYEYAGSHLQSSE